MDGCPLWVLCVLSGFYIFKVLIFVFEFNNPPKIIAVIDVAK